MRPVLIVIDSPRFNLLSGIVERYEDISLQTLIAKPSIETLNHRILHGFAGIDKVKLDAMVVGPGVKYLRGEFTPVVHGDHLWIPTPLSHPLHGCDHLRPGQRKIDLD